MADDTRPAESTPGDGSDELLDRLDEDILQRLGSLFAGGDGPPDGFTDRMRFAVAARGLADELAQLSDGVPVAARGQDRPARTWTFEAPSLTILVTAEPTRARTRVDGWLAPAAAGRTVRLRLADGGVRETVSDGQGRFGYADGPTGLVQLVVVADDDGPGVVTPTFEL